MNSRSGRNGSAVHGRWAALPLALALVVGLAASPSPARASGGEHDVSVIVRELPGAGDAPEELVARLGGEVGLQMPIITGFVARVQAADLATLQSADGVHSVTPNAPVQLLNTLDGLDPDWEPGSLQNVQEAIGADAYWARGLTGAGVDVALIDSGVAPVQGLDGWGKVVWGPDLSFESQVPDVAWYDTYGHGTHMAGIIAGHDSSAPEPSGVDREHFTGVAPGARIVSVKVADASGATDVSQVIAAIDWVVQHRYDNGMNIRVLNLSFGTDGVQHYAVDPLAYAAEVAWHSGIVVVVAGGNAGYGSAKLNNPAYDPFVIAVGATDTQGTDDFSDDVVSEFSSFGDGGRNPDVVAPGTRVASLRAPDSMLDQRYPGAHVNSRFFRGSGTSQAAAVVSGAAALILQQRPWATPDQVKALLTSTARRLPAADDRGEGRGMINLRAAISRRTPTTQQTFQRSTGLGSLDAARGSLHLTNGSIWLDGEQDIFGASWNSEERADASSNEYAWWGGDWNASTWAGSWWEGEGEDAYWPLTTWSSALWTGEWVDPWTGASWRGDGWEGASWRTDIWSGASWRGDVWSGGAWE